MLKLARLEYKKNNIAKYIRNACILALVLCLFLFVYQLLELEGFYAFSAINEEKSVLFQTPGQVT